MVFVVLGKENAEGILLKGPRCRAALMDGALLAKAGANISKFAAILTLHPSRFHWRVSFGEKSGSRESNKPIVAMSRLFRSMPPALGRGKGSVLSRPRKFRAVYGRKMAAFIGAAFSFTEPAESVFAWSGNPGNSILLLLENVMKVKSKVKAGCVGDGYQSQQRCETFRR